MCAREGVSLEETKDGVVLGRIEGGEGVYESFPLNVGYLLSRPAKGLSVIA